jgi:hypothetical protein
MRYFQCSDCRHFWKIVFWEDGKGAKMACPGCKSLNVHQIEKIRGWDREGKYTSLVNDEAQVSKNTGVESVDVVSKKDR